MGCASCATGGCGVKNRINGNVAVAGCKSNGSCGTGGCNKLNSFDWLIDMDFAPNERFPFVEVRFKNGRKEFLKNTQALDLITGDAVIVESTTGGYHLGHIALQGELVRLQMKKKNIAEDHEEIKKIIRFATAEELQKLEELQKKELPMMYRTREISKTLGLEMKLSDVEIQLDNSKATFYYSADDRVDFRELIKVLASEFKIRIEMRQISLRHEAARLGGVGVCGRELCCSTWLSDFKNVATSAARYQNLSLNPAKLSGQCGRLKCCLNYELDTYMEALKDIPEVNTPLQTKKGLAILHKTDIFKKIMWFAYNAETDWIPVSTERVLEIQKLNSQQIIPESLDLNEAPIIEKKTNEPLIAREEKKQNKNNKNKNRRKKNKPKNNHNGSQNHQSNKK
ncbi:MAG: Signal peptidase-like protein [Cytophagales bacterium]|nr:MAG: Signal peptidase-like protein [Cytophagales bacterium]